MKKQYSRTVMPMLVVATALLTPPQAITGSLDSPAAHTDAGSAMYRTEDIYNRLQSGEAGVKRSGAFGESVTPPSEGGRSLNEIMSVAPKVDSTKGAIGSDVASGKTYWSVRTDSQWGLQSGTGIFTPAPVARSGQTTIYAAGDDGVRQKGVGVTAPRFIDNGNGTITDALTGLVWLKNANCFNAVAWSAALTAAQSLNSGECGLNDNSAEGDWRLPQVNELASLVDYGRASPALPLGHPFTSVQSNAYWSSTTLTTSTTSAMVVNFVAGSIDGPGKTVSNLAWPVRTGQ